MAAPWYAAGLRFSCLRCGDCCRGEPGYVWITPAEISAAAEFLAMPPEQFAREYVRREQGGLSLIELANGDCILWTQQGCRIYAVRPRQCRTFPFWPEYLRSQSAWLRAQRRCPGVGTGKQHSLDEIAARLKENYD